MILVGHLRFLLTLFLLSSKGQPKLAFLEIMSVVDLFLQDEICLSLFGWARVQYYSEVADLEENKWLLAKIASVLHAQMRLNWDVKLLPLWMRR